MFAPRTGDAREFAAFYIEDLAPKTASDMHLPEFAARALAAYALEIG